MIASVPDLCILFTFVSRFQWRLHMKFGSDWANSFREIYVGKQMAIYMYKAQGRGQITH